MPKTTHAPSSPVTSSSRGGTRPPTPSQSASARRPSFARTDGNPHPPAFGSPSASFDPLPTETAASAPHEEIARRAYSLWEKGGRQAGFELDHWIAAEHELRGDSGDSWNAQASLQARGPSASS